MYPYSLYLAFLQLKSHRILTAIIALAIGVGVASTMTIFTVIHVLSRDPLPGRSHLLYYPTLDSRPDNWHADGPDPSLNLTWLDASNLLAAKRGVRQAAMAGGELLLKSDAPLALPAMVQGRYVTPDFFPMFGVPFLTGRAWNAQEETERVHVMVINASLSRRLFGTTNSVGKLIRTRDTEFTVIGVINDWAPRPLFYNDVDGKSFSREDDFFLPLHTAVDMGTNTTGNRVCWGSDSNPSLTSDQCTWLQFWVELQPDQVAGYETFLANYQRQQADAGRFSHRGSAHLYPLNAWLKRQNLIPNGVWLQFALVSCFFFVCLVNIFSLLLTKFMGRASEVSVRRSLGARRRDVFLQFTMEASLIGFVGGILGLALTQIGLAIVHGQPDSYAKVVHTDITMLAATLVVAVLGCVLAGAIPAWRASSVAPSLYLKD